MRVALVPVLLFGFLVWDMTENDARDARTITASLDDASRQVRLR